MKIIFEKDDEVCMDSLRHSKESGEYNPLSFLHVGEEYSVNFKVIDSIKANAFILEFMRTDDAGRKAIEDAIGIHVETVYNASVGTKLSQIQELIKEFECKAKAILK